MVATFWNDQKPSQKTIKIGDHCHLSSHRGQYLIAGSKQKWIRCLWPALRCAMEDVTGATPMTLETSKWSKLGCWKKCGSLNVLQTFNQEIQEASRLSLTEMSLADNILVISSLGRKTNCSIAVFPMVGATLWLTFHDNQLLTQAS